MTDSPEVPRKYGVTVKNIIWLCIGPASEVVIYNSKKKKKVKTQQQTNNFTDNLNLS